MPDTIRTLSELSALFADNNSGTITPQDIRDLMVSQMVHGEIGSAAKAPIALISGANVLDFNVAGTVGRGLTADTVNKRLADVPVEMKAVIHAEVLFKGAQNQTYTFAVFVNDLQVTRLTRTARPTAAADIRQVAFSTSHQLSAGDFIDVRVSAGTNTFELLFGVLRVQRIGVE